MVDRPAAGRDRWVGVAVAGAVGARRHGVCRDISLEGGEGGGGRQGRGWAAAGRRGGVVALTPGFSPRIGRGERSCWACRGIIANDTRVSRVRGLPRRAADGAATVIAAAGARRLVSHDLG